MGSAGVLHGDIDIDGFFWNDTSVEPSGSASVPSCKLARCPICTPLFKGP